MCSMSANPGSEPKLSLKPLLGGLLFPRVVKRTLLQATRDEFTPEGAPIMRPLTPTGTCGPRRYLSLATPTGTTTTPWLSCGASRVVTAAHYGSPRFDLAWGASSWT